MKRNILKLFAIVAAFFIGVSINNSCGESKNDGSASVQELWNAIHALQAEIKALKPTGETGETLIDGLYFNRAGSVSSKPKAITVDGKAPMEYMYVYDNKGRIQQQTTYLVNVWRMITTYEYYDKKVITTAVTTYDNSPALNTTSKTVTEYY